MQHRKAKVANFDNCSAFPEFDLCWRPIYVVRGEKIEDPQDESAPCRKVG